MNGKRPGQAIFFGCFQKSDQIFNRRLLVMMAAVARIGLLINAAGLQAVFGKHKSKSVAVCVPGLPDLSHLGHVATDAAAKSVNGVGMAIL